MKKYPIIMIIKKMISKTEPNIIKYKGEDDEE
jgi:hypothetical protein